MNEWPGGGVTDLMVKADHYRRNWSNFVLYSATAKFSVNKRVLIYTNTGHRHANSQAVI
ncbi:hypothetical protein PS691_00305 [Pseudomonas fluorescens]|uniref:Uncharacterized protein n=1 Tax=Pseudomonas fluorescens TaxID=294 RepID=A0A5E6ZYI9_PSEFL|nr:hypothetical protein PS691_00305 [Pseudomonas fluorescens]